MVDVGLFLLCGVVMKVQTRAYQRAESYRLVVIAVNLELLLRELLRESLAGDRGSLVEFQQLVQLAPSKMRDMIIELL